MISEVELRDWDKVDFKEIEKILPNLSWDNEKYFNIVCYFIDQVKALREEQMKRFPVLLRKG